jgi:hypothetical protein
MPDVTWFPVDETPPEPDEYWVRWIALGQEKVAVGVYDANGCWTTSDGWGITHLITHYAKIIYPEPPEDA